MRLGFAMMAVLVGCDAFVDERSEPSRPGDHREPATLIVGRASDAISLDPAIPSDNESVEIVDQVFERLVRYDPESDALTGWLAESWRVSRNGELWRFTLRDGVRFHDGTLMDAAAVVFSFERQRDVSHPYHDPRFSYWSNVYRNIVSVRALTSRVVEIEIERAYAPFLANLTMFPVSIVSPAAVRKYGSEFVRHPVGTGPFRFKDWHPGKRIVLERHDAYWDPGERAQLRRLIFQAMPDSRQRATSLESGAIDVAYSIRPGELQFVALHPALRLQEYPANNVAYLAMNTQRAPFDDIRVRRAVNYAINKEPLVKLIYQGHGVPALGPLPQTVWGAHAGVVQYPFEAEKARQLLAEAQAAGRFDPGRVYKLFAPSVPRVYMPDPYEAARVLQANLREVGIQTQVVYGDFASHLTAVQNAEHDLCLLGWVGDNEDPDNFLHNLFSRENAVVGSARNVAFYRNAEVQGLLVLGQETLGRDQRIPIYRRAQELIAQDAPWVPLAHAQVVIAMRNDLVGVTPTRLGHLQFRTIRRAHSSR